MSEVYYLWFCKLVWDAPVEIYKPMQAGINIPDIMDGIHLTMVPKMATPPNEMVYARKNFLERMDPVNRRITSTTAGLGKRTAGFHMINEPGPDQRRR